MRYREFKIVNEAPLSQGFFKYKGTKKDRGPILLQKIEDETPFKLKLKDGKVIDVIIKSSEYAKAARWIKNPSGPLRLLTTKGLVVSLSNLVKTKEFGGEEAGKRESIEQGQIAEIADQLEKLKNGADFIPLVVGDKVVNAAAVEKERGSVNGRAPKSDMTVLNEVGEAVAWVSLKGRPFRWGGWTHLMNLPEISNWLERIRAETGGKFESSQSYGLHISNDIKTKIVYGKEFGGKRGISNVDCVLIGDVKIKAQDGGYKLSAGTVYTNGEIPHGGDDPYLVLRYMNGRNDAGFVNCRAETNTANEGRKVKWLDSDTQVDAQEQPDQTPKSKEKTKTNIQKKKPTVQPKSSLKQKPETKQKTEPKPFTAPTQTLPPYLDVDIDDDEFGNYNNQFGKPKG